MCSQPQAAHFRRQSSILQVLLRRRGCRSRDAYPRFSSGCVVRLGPMPTKQLTAIIEREGDGYVALCPEVDVSSQGTTIDEARANLVEALELFFEAADPSEIQSRMHDEVLVTRLEVAVG